MGSTPQADVLNNRHYFKADVASAASNAAGARSDIVGPFDQNIRVRALWYVPTQGDMDVSTATSTASYRRLRLHNGGAAYTGTLTASIIGSINLTSSLGSFEARAFGTVSTAITLASGHTMYVSNVTIGAASANGTVLQAGRVIGSYEEI